MVYLGCRAVSVNTEIHRNTPQGIYIPTEIHTHTSIVMVQVVVMFGYALFLINIGGTRAKYLSRLLV